MRRRKIALLFALFFTGTLIHAQSSPDTPSPINNALETARSFSGGNDDWLPYEHDFDSVTMILVPVGCFDMGMNAPQSDELKTNEICFEQPFWMDKTEVTQSDFLRADGEKVRSDEFSGDAQPVENITWFEAKDFCEKRASRLPTEAEWEYAARGPNNLIYPWGNEWNADNLVWNWWESEGAVNAGSIPSGVSWVGTLDMSGNVWEWTNSLFTPYPYNAEDGREAETGFQEDVFRVLRGGSWFGLNPDSFTTVFREWHRPTQADSSYGFRCVRDS